jgi:hypothetical protein
MGTKNEVVNSWKPESCCETNTPFYGDGFLGNNSVQNASPCKRRFNKISVDTNKQQTCSMVTARLYKRPCGEERFHLSVKFEKVKLGSVFQGTQTRERLRWRGSATYTKDRPVLSPERVPHKNKTVTAKQ